MKCLIIFSGNTISGAEFVLQNYLRNTKYPDVQFFAICPDSKTKEFLVNSGLDPRNIFVSPFLSQVGVKRSKSFLLKAFLLLAKMTLVTIGRIHVQVISELKKVDTILGKNTYDSLYLPFVKGRKRIILHIHDILDNSFVSNYVRKIIQSRVDSVISVSDEVKRSIGENLKDKVRVVYNGIDISSVRRQEDYENQLVWVGSLEKRKNPLEFVEIIQGLLQKGVRIKGVMVYKYYEEEYLRKIQETVKDKNYIEIKYNIPRSSVIEEIGRSLALVITSIVDPLPTVILESYSVGVPVISANRTGMREMVIHKKTGILYNSVDEIVSEWNEIFEFLTKRRDEVFENIKSLVKERFSTEVFVKSIDEILFGTQS